MSTRSTPDLVIVGAGAAGIGAARTARSLGLSYRVFEAMGRTGGRALTERETFGFPWDHGCRWLHSGSVNPLCEIADEFSHTYRMGELPEKLWAGDGWAGESETHALFESGERCYAAALAAGREGHDVPASFVVDRHEPGWALSIAG